MKIIHCADLHLDSKMNAHLSKEQAKERKGELLQTFSHMIDIAAAEGVKAILIAGDMFDTRNISATARNHVIKAIEDNSDILFYYLKGNHDSDNFLSSMESIPDNLKLFSDSWTSYELGNVVISGLELCGENSLSAYSSLVLNEAKINIVMLHGQESESDSKDKAEIINIKGL